MNKRMILSIVGTIVELEAALMILPLAVSILYGEKCILGFVIAIAGAALLGIIMKATAKPRTTVIYAKEGFIITAAAWLFMSAIGALPFVLSGEIPNYIDAFFETVSGFTTTGASILTDVEAMSKGLLFWRSFTHWIGGMGVLVLLVALIPSASAGRSIHILRAEMPGPTMGKLVPKLKDTAKILYLIYIGLTVTEIIILICGGMSVFDSVVHAFGTAGTGGFGIKADSITSYSPFLQWTITVFMFLFGVNFNTYFFILRRNFKNAFKNTELICYFLIVVVATGIITFNIMPICHNNFGDALRHSAFQVSSITTTTGYATTDFNLWPGLSKAVLLILMFIGASAGSTGGGFKVSRVILLFKLVGREIRKMLHPRSVTTSKMDGKKLDDDVLNGAGTYLSLYMITLFAGFLILSIEPAEQFDIETNFSAIVSCFNNIGPGFGSVGPASNYSAYSVLSKLVLSGAMLLGRLELYPLIIAFSPSVWRKNR